MNVLDALLAPFYLLIKNLYISFLTLTNSNGLSIFLLSASVSILLLPLFIFIEKAKKRNDSIKLKMKPLIDEIKRVYSGQERHYYIQTIYRQHNYNPLRSLIPILSLFIQIPFFIAAYKFLNTFEPLKGASFLILDDLSRPDGLVAGMNLLPILMTVINIVTAYFYTINGNISERKQTFLVAGIFLVLLYNFPSGLVLYWTMNNVFSFLRLLITNPEVFSSFSHQTTLCFRYKHIKAKILENKRPVIALIFALFVIGLLGQLHWAIHHTFKDFPLRLLMVFILTLIVTYTLIGINVLEKLSLKAFANLPPIYFYSLLFFATYFLLAGEFYFSGKNITLLYLSTTFLVPAQILGFSRVIYTKAWVPKILKTVTLVMCVLLLISQIVVTLYILFGEKVVLTNFIISSLKYEHLGALGIFLCFISLPYSLANHSPVGIRYNSLHHPIYLLSILYLTGYITLWQPLIVFSSSVETFSFSAIDILKNNGLPFIISFLILAIVYYLLPQKFKSIAAFIMLFLTSLLIFNSQISPLNLGALHENRFAEHQNLAAPLVKYFIDSLILIILSITLWRLFIKNRWLKAVLVSLVLLNLFIIGDSLHKAIKTQRFFPANINRVNNIAFSQFSPNIVFFLADAFQGKYIGQIMEENPEIRENFTGFVWFPNTLSVTNYTHSSIPSLWGGEKYNVDWMNSDSSTTISEKLTMVSRLFLTSVNQKGYVLSGNKFYGSQIEETEYNFIPLWHPLWKDLYTDIVKTEVSNFWFNRLIENAIFQSVPLALKPKIYNNTKWFFPKAKILENDYGWHDHAFIKLLPKISVNTAKEPQFIYIHSEACHHPWKILKEDGTLKVNVSPLESATWLIKELNNWITWMKKSGVYDNTKIILVSDHGPSWYHFDKDRNFLWNGIIPDPNEPKKINPEDLWNLQPLLMVKDFNSKSPLLTNWTLMSNADAYGFTFYEKYLQSIEAKNREVKTWWTIWTGRMLEQKVMKIRFRFKVHENIYDLKNWKREQ